MKIKNVLTRILPFIFVGGMFFAITWRLDNLINFQNVDLIPTDTIIWLAFFPLVFIIISMFLGLTHRIFIKPFEIIALCVISLLICYFLYSRTVSPNVFKSKHIRIFGPELTAKAFIKNQITPTLSYKFFAINGHEEICDWGGTLLQYHFGSDLFPTLRMSLEYVDIHNVALLDISKYNAIVRVSGWYAFKHSFWGDVYFCPGPRRFMTRLHLRKMKGQWYVTHYDEETRKRQCNDVDRNLNILLSIKDLNTYYHAFINYQGIDKTKKLPDILYFNKNGRVFKRHYYVKGILEGCVGFFDYSNPRKPIERIWINSKLKMNPENEKDISTLSNSILIRKVTYSDEECQKVEHYHDPLKGESRWITYDKENYIKMVQVYDVKKDSQTKPSSGLKWTEIYKKTSNDREKIKSQEKFVRSFCHIPVMDPENKRKLKYSARYASTETVNDKEYDIYYEVCFDKSGDPGPMTNGQLPKDAELKSKEYIDKISGKLLKILYYKKFQGRPFSSYEYRVFRISFKKYEYRVFWIGFKKYDPKTGKELYEDIYLDIDNKKYKDMVPPEDGYRVTKWNRIVNFSKLCFKKKFYRGIDYRRFEPVYLNRYLGDNRYIVCEYVFRSGPGGFYIEDIMDENKKLIHKKDESAGVLRTAYTVHDEDYGIICETRRKGKNPAHNIPPSLSRVFHPTPKKVKK